MELRPATEDIMELVETVSGVPVEVSRVPGIGLAASLQLARGDARAHRVMLDPASGFSPDVLVSRECGRVLRLHAMPPDQRAELAPSETGRAAAERMIRAPDGVAARQGLSEEQVRRLAGRLYGGIVLQLAATAVGLRIDAWLSESFPDLSDVLEETVRRELDGHVELMSPAVRDVTPEGAWLASLAMNVAEADYWSRVWGERSLLERYRATRSFRFGRALMRIWREMPSEPAYDRELVDAWARELGLDGWYGWRPYEAPSRRA